MIPKFTLLLAKVVSHSLVTPDHLCSSKFYVHLESLQSIEKDQQQKHLIKMFTAVPKLVQTKVIKKLTLEIPETFHKQMTISFF